ALQRAARLLLRGALRLQLLHPATGTLERVPLLVHQLPNEGDELELAGLVDPVAGPVLGGRELRKLSLPVAEHVRLEVEHLADLANRVERPSASHPLREPATTSTLSAVPPYFRRS